MSLIAWNCQGLANPCTIRFLKEIINQYRPSVVFLSETFVKIEKIEKIKKQVGFAGCFGVDVQGHGGGVALLWKNEGGIMVTKSCNNFIDFEVVNENLGRWRYTGYYGFPEREKCRFMDNDSWFGSGVAFTLVYNRRF